MKPTATENPLLDALKQVIGDTMDDTVVKEAVSSFKWLVLKKNKFLVKEGEVCPYFCFIQSGILQHEIVVNGEEITTYLALRNTFTASLSSYLLGQPSRKSIKALFDCELWVLDLKTFRNLIRSNAAFHRFYHNLIERQICLIDDYRIDLLTLTPEERYKKLFTNEPQLIHQVPLRHLASFLGISSRHMSRIRQNIK